MPYTILYYRRVSVPKMESVTVPSARDALRVIDGIEKRNEIVDTITGPDGSSIRVTELTTKAWHER